MNSNPLNSNDAAPEVWATLLRVIVVPLIASTTVFGSNAPVPLNTVTSIPTTMPAAELTVISLDTFDNVVDTGVTRLGAWIPSGYELSANPMLARDASWILKTYVFPE